MKCDQKERPGEEESLDRGVQEQKHTLPTELTTKDSEEGLMVLEKDDSKPAEQEHVTAEEEEEEKNEKAKEREKLAEILEGTDKKVGGQDHLDPATLGHVKAIIKDIIEKVMAREQEQPDLATQGHMRKENESGASEIMQGIIEEVIEIGEEDCEECEEKRKVLLEKNCKYCGEGKNQSILL